MKNETKPRKRTSKRVTTRKIVNATVKVYKRKSKDLATYFRLRNKNSKSPDRKLSSCTVIDTADVAEGESYVIFKKRNNGTWELIISKDMEQQVDELESITILRDRKLADL
jgi:hypothetical protein